VTVKTPADATNPTCKPTLYFHIDVKTPSSSATRKDFKVSYTKYLVPSD